MAEIAEMGVCDKKNWKRAWLSMELELKYMLVLCISFIKYTATWPAPHLSCQEITGPVWLVVWSDGSRSQVGYEM